MTDDNVDNEILDIHVFGVASKMSAEENGTMADIGMSKS